MRNTPGYCPGRARRGSALLAIVLVAIAPRAAHSETKPLPALRPVGAALVDEAGRPVTLRGCNLGNWLLLEPWMMGLPRGAFADQHAILTCLEERFGKNKAEELLDLYRTSWIGPREFDVVRSFKFNLVRVPFHHGLLATEEDPFTLRPDAFEWLDRAVELAEAAGVYVILDMHGAPGGQSHDMPTGHAGQNRLLTDEACQKRAAWMWQRIAERYRNRASVIAYDLLNEPWGDFKSDIDGQLVPVMQRIHTEIRAVDPDKLVLLAGSLRGIRCYGDPAGTAWRNVGFTEHYYPGLFGQGPPVLETHAWFIARDLAAKRQEVRRLEVPYLVGEFNVVHDGCARPELMRRYFDTFTAAGWMATMWSLRVHRNSPEPRSGNWPMATNAEPFALPDFRTATEAEIAAAFTRLGSVPLAVDEKLREALTAAEPPSLVLEAFEIPAAPPESVAPEGWQSSTMGGAVAGFARPLAADRLALWAGGWDIFGKADAFQFVHRPAPRAFRLSGGLEEFHTPKPFAKAGLMLRAAAEPDAPQAFVHVFPDGRIMASWRAARGGATTEKCLGVSPLSVALSLERGPGGLLAWHSGGEGEWQSWAFPPLPALAEGGEVGFAAAAHHESALAYAVLTHRFEESPAATPPAQPGPARPNLLANGGFDDASGQSTLAEGWTHAGSALRRETPPGAKSGEARIRFDPALRPGGEYAALTQDVAGLIAGQRYTFSVAVRCADNAPAACSGEEIELRMEATQPERRMQVAARSWRIRDLPAGAWCRIFVEGTWPGEKARLTIQVEGPSPDEARGGWWLDRAEFRATGVELTRGASPAGMKP